MLSVDRLDLSDAQRIVEGARARAMEIGVPMCIAVVDESGNLLAFARMDGAKVPSVAIAIDKAFTAAGTRKPTGDLGNASQPGQPVYGLSATIGGRMVVIAGGVPVLLDGVTVGGIGVSSGRPDQDLDVAQAGCRAFSPIETAD